MEVTDKNRLAYILSNIFHVLVTNYTPKGTAQAVYNQLQSLNVPQIRFQVCKNRYAPYFMETMHYSLFCLTRSLLADIFPLLKICQNVFYHCTIQWEQTQDKFIDVESPG